MLCINGEVKSPKGETGVFFICKLTGNVCRYSKWCTQTKDFVMITDNLGNSCRDISLKKKEVVKEAVFKPTTSKYNSKKKKS